MNRFYPTGTDGIFKCVIHPGRKDGKNGKGIAFDLIVGIGDKPGHDYAALSVLHRIHHEKPFERLLAPEFRQTWLQLNDRLDQKNKNIEKVAENRQRREKINREREQRESNRQSGVISISAQVRQTIEDAVVCHRIQFPSSNRKPCRENSSAVKKGQDKNLYTDLLQKGFGRLDAKQASLLFDNFMDAFEYLIWNLDESELPSAFAPSSEVEVVQFISRRGADDPSHLTASSMREIMTRLTCLSKLSANKVLKESKGSFSDAFVMLYHMLTYNMLKNYLQIPFSKEDAVCARSERDTEQESMNVIYGSDVSCGIGQLSDFQSLWASIVTIRDEIPGISRREHLQIAFLDYAGNYPFSAPLVLISSCFDRRAPGGDLLSSAEKRLLMRAAAGKIAMLHRTNHHQDKPEAVPVIHSIVSYLCEASEEQLLESANQRLFEPESLTQGGFIVGPSTTPTSSKPGQGSRRILRNVEKPQPVSKLCESPELTKMREYRSALPAHCMRQAILKAVSQNQVVVISGATGSGKTTQVPQFLLEEGARSGRPMSVVCTQPRRIAAISVAERVAAERCQKIGESVGYQVKLDTKKSSSTRLLFCTTGVLLRRLQSDPQLDAFTHILVDEVHERSVETDFFLLLLREVLFARPSIKIVLMSATLEANKFSSYFSSINGKRMDVQVISIPGRAFPVNHLYLKDVIAFCGYRMKPGDPFSKKSHIKGTKSKYGPEPPQDATLPVYKWRASLTDEDESIPSSEDESGFEDTPSESVLTPLPSCDPKNPDVERTVGLIDQQKINLDLISMLVNRIDVEGRRRNEMGAILIFLPGAADIIALIRKLKSDLGANRVAPLPLHSNLSPEDQKRVFERASVGVRKIICATNIAETSITVEDVTVVIDTLRAKQMNYDTLNRCSVLEENFISRAEAQQRAGRAGRVSSGTCYRLVTKGVFEDRLIAQPVPEIQRVGMESLVLNALSILPNPEVKEDPTTLFAKALDPPRKSFVECAVTTLIELGALRVGEHGSDDPNAVRKRVELTALGRHLSRLPTDSRIGKLLIYGATLGCLDVALTICASVSEGSPFVAPFDKRDEAREAKKAFAWGKSDLLTFVKAFNAWRKLREDGSGRDVEASFCLKNFLSRKGLIAIAESRKQLADSLVDAGFCVSAGQNWERAPMLNANGKNVRVLRAVICAALYPNIVRIDLPRTKYEEVAGGTIAKKHEAKELQLRSKTGRVFLHPESVNFFEGDYETRWLSCFSMVKTSKVFMRDSTMISPYAILMFGGEIKVQHFKEQMTVDDWVVFKAQSRVAIIARELRSELDSLLLRKFEKPGVDLTSEGRVVTDAIILLLTQEAS